MTDIEWFYEDGGIRKGPVSTVEIQQLVNSQQLGPGTLVWRNGLLDWTPLEQTELADMMIRQSVPSLPPKSIRDRWIWSLTCVPLFTILTPTEPLFWFVAPWVLNIVFIILDNRVLKAAEYTPPTIGWVVLVPGYIYLRSRQVKKNLAPLLGWFISFVGANAIASQGFNLYAQLPACDDPGVQQVVSRILDAQGLIPSGQRLYMGAMQETSYSEAPEKRGCVALMATSVGQLPGAYSIEWSRKLFSEYYVRVESL
ncbi:hypothetical protein D3C78_955910 [compost metagenome]